VPWKNAVPENPFDDPEFAARYEDWYGGPGATAARAERLRRSRCFRSPFADRSFDLVALVATLEFLPAPPRALREAVRVARVGLVLGTFHRFGLYALRQKLRSSAVWPRARFFGKPQIRKLLSEAAGSRARGILQWTTSWSLVPLGDFVVTASKLSPDK
jgi:hypothetical protein